MKTDISVQLGSLIDRIGDSMILRILKNKKQSKTRRIKNILFLLSRKRGAKKSWNKRHNNVFKINSSYAKSCTEKVEKDHKLTWSDFSKKIDLSTLRICKNISGNADPLIVPEDIFSSDIEPTLNIDSTVDYLSIKSFYNRWFEKGLFPKDIFHKIEGEYYDENLEPVHNSDFQKLFVNIDFPVVLKPNIDSYGGQGIHFVESKDHLLKLCKNERNFVVQEKIEQHNFFNKFSPSSLNTIRVYLYRSVKTEEMIVLSKAFRMGKNGSLDNETAGGIHTMIKPDGTMNGYAVDKFGTRYYEHPNSKLKFDCKIPQNTKLEEISKKVAQQVFFGRVIGLDACYDVNGHWRLIEINTNGHTIRFSQYGGKPFFGEFTEEVIDYCKANHWALKA